MLTYTFVEHFHNDIFDETFFSNYKKKKACDTNRGAAFFVYTTCTWNIARMVIGWYENNIQYKQGKVCWNERFVLKITLKQNNSYQVE